MVRMPMRQWMLAITRFADRLLGDLDGLDWDDGIKRLQRNWIGRSEVRHAVLPYDLRASLCAAQLQDWGSAACVVELPEAVSTVAAVSDQRKGLADAIVVSCIDYDRC